MAKKFIFVSTYASPELCSSEYLSLDIMKQCHDAGFEVVRLKPNPVRGLDKSQIKKFKKNTLNEETYGISQTFKCFSFNERNFLFRLIRYHSYSKKVKRYIRKNLSDIAGIFVWSYPPLGLSKPVCRFAKKHNIPFIFDVHDIQPDILRSNNYFLNKIIRENTLYLLGNSNHIFTLSQDMKLTLVDKGVDDNKVSVIPPWPYFVHDNVDVPDAIKQVMEDKFVVAYIGNVGSFQNVNKILEVVMLAKQLHCNDILFLFVGDGSFASKVQDVAKENHNVAYFHKISEQEAAKLYKIVDINLITLNDSVIKYACPSKTPMVVEAGKNILVLANNSLYRHELEALGAYTCEPSASSDDILNKIIEIRNNPCHIQRNSNIYQRETCLQKWLDFFKSMHNDDNNK